jgi:hypothetical protein
MANSAAIALQNFRTSNLGGSIADGTAKSGYQLENEAGFMAVILQILSELDTGWSGTGNAYQYVSAKLAGYGAGNQASKYFDTVFARQIRGA